MARQRKLVYAGTVGRSFAEASELLAELADLPVSAKQVERVARRVGAERVAERDTEVARFQTLPLVAQCAPPAGVTPPDLAVGMVAGGRLQILDRTAAAAAAPAAPEAAGTVAAPTAATVPPRVAAADTAATEAWDEAKPSPGHWREDKVGLLLTMKSAVATVDPCPEVPPSLLDAPRLAELARELTKHVKQSDAAVADADAPETPAAVLRAETV